MASESKVVSIKKIQQAETILFWIERPAIFLFVFLGGTTRFLHYSLGLFVFTNFYYASLAYDRLFVTPRPKAPSHSKLFFVERYGIWLEAMYFIIALPVYRYAAAAVFVIVNMKFVMNLVGMNMSQILNPNPKADKKEEEKQKSVTVEESQEEKEKESSPEEKDKLNEIKEVPETEIILSPEDQMVSNKEEDEDEDEKDDDSDYDDDSEDDDEVNEEIIEPIVSEEKLPETGDIEPDVNHEMRKAAILIENNTVEKEIVSNKGKEGEVEDEEEDDCSDDEDDDDDEEEEDSDDYSYYDSDSDSYDDDDDEEEEEEEESDDDDQEDEPEVNEEKLPENDNFEPVVTNEKLPETKDIEPDVHHEMGKAALIENNTAEKEIVSNKGEKGEVENEEEDDYSDDEDDDDYEEEEEDSDDDSYYDSDSNSYDDDEEEEEESDDEQEDDSGEEGIMENESSEKETKTEEIQENVQAKDNSTKDEEVKETSENEKKAGEESKDKRNDAIIWEVIEEIEGELRTHMLREEEDRHAELSEANAALIKEKELLVQDFEARSIKWEDERKSLTSKLDIDANESLKIYQENEKKYEEERLDWENEKDFLSSKIEVIYTAWNDLEEKCSKLEEENKLLLKIGTNCPPSFDEDQFNLLVHEYDSKCQRLEKEKADLHATLTYSLHECESKCKSLQKEKGYLQSRLTAAAAEIDFYRGYIHNLGLIHN